MSKLYEVNMFTLNVKERVKSFLEQIDKDPPRSGCIEIQPMMEWNTCLNLEGIYTM